MPFTNQDFLESAARAKKVAPRQPCSSHGEDGCLRQSSVASSALSSVSSSVLSSVPVSLLAFETAQQAECRTSCLHHSCRTFRPAHADAMPDAGFPRPIALNQLSINHLYYLHKKLQDLQEGVDAAEKMVQLCRARMLLFHPVDVQRYTHKTRRRRKELEELLTGLRSRNAYFGHIDMPERLDFIKAVETSGLAHGQVPPQQSLYWNEFVESRRKDCRKDCRSVAEYHVEADFYNKRRDMWFNGWNFKDAFARGGGSAVDEEEIAPDEMVPESRGTKKRVRSQSSDILDEKMARIKRYSY